MKFGGRWDGGWILSKDITYMKFSKNELSIIFKKK